MPEMIENIINTWDDDRKTEFLINLKNLYKFIHEYMTMWTQWAKAMSKFEWIKLDNAIELSAVTASVQELGIKVDHEKLKSDIDLVNSVLTTTAFVADSHIQKWVDVFHQIPSIDELGKIVDRLLSYPATNATCERLFSEIGFFWRKERANLSLATVKNAMSVRYNLERACSSVLQMLISDQSLRNSIRSSEKYDNAKLKNEQHLTSIMNQMPVDSDTSESEDDDEEDEDADENGKDNYFADFNEEPLYKKFLLITASSSNDASELSDDSQEMFNPPSSEPEILMDWSEVSRSEVDFIQKDASEHFEPLLNTNEHPYDKEYETRSKFEY